ncbi:hypothetical protein NIES4075_15490 [Tolypothrix sp. NIES-4075]|uniref:hypothetical protein n=1 Tax=Tolypothrix sp. NIES-4075 TaxID=2005459 RepID=UPI000B5C8AD2|nr:hypothetical protein [Tolypothrix sp. NIES-4075]GAX40583.1 hypothetical protein NIES4075_15490 [Tolypothrix sp. NIES-4075]
MLNLKDFTVWIPHKRVKLVGLDSASRLPDANFNDLEIVDAQTSDGFGLTLTAEDESGRLRFNGGFARSTITLGKA